LYLEVYPDVVFILNFFVDFILLLLLKLVSRKDSTLRRLIGAAGIGGLAEAILSIFPWITFNMNSGYVTILLQCINGMIKLSSLLFMIFIAFGRMKWKDYIRLILAFLLITYFAGGFMNSVYYHTMIRFALFPVRNTIAIRSIAAKYVIAIMLLIIPITSLFLLLQKIYRRNLRELYEVELYYKDHSYTTTGLYDTGNCLYDPIYGRPVIVIERSILDNLLTREEQEALNTEINCSKETSIPEALQTRLHIIPYSSIGKAQGMMPGLLLDKILIHVGKDTICCNRVIAAISEQKHSPREEYHVILHKELV
jgi:stage II sporulation protein GA (sporulation sigma-E factor processing peptidase)